MLVVVSCDSHCSFSARHPVKTIHEGGVRAPKCTLGLFFCSLCHVDFFKIILEFCRDLCLNVVFKNKGRNFSTLGAGRTHLS